MSVGAFNLSNYLQTLYQSVDLMLCVGTRLRSNETWNYKLQFPENLIMVDCDPAANGRNYICKKFIHADSKLFLEQLVEKIDGKLSIESGICR